MGQNNIIELNGKQYDALTGALLGESRIKATPASRTQHTQRQGRVIDGFIRKKPLGATSQPVVVKPAAPAPKKLSAAAHPGTTQIQKATKSQKSGKQAKHFDIQRAPVPSLKHHQPERPKTLMRHVVHKPQVNMKPAIKMTAPAEMIAAPKGTIAKPLEKKVSVTQVNPVRMARAAHVPKSHHIRRFGFHKQQGSVTTPATAHVPATKHHQPVVAASQPTQAQTITATVVPAQRARNTAYYASRPVNRASQSATTVVAANSEPVGTAKSVDVFEAALAHATSHEQAPPAHARRHTARQKKLINALAGVGAFLLIGGFTTYMNMTNIELRIASMRAGFHAQLPTYKPTGFALDGGIESSDGRVAMSYRSGESLYTITQEASDWNSATLLDQASSEQGEPTQTIQSKGRTIYIYDDSNATWVNGGVRYQINGNAALDAGELVSLATSM